MIKLNGIEVRFEKFPNGETRIARESLSRLHTIYGSYDYINIMFKYEDDSDLIKLMILKKHLETFEKRYGCAMEYGIKLVITYMPYSRMDRSENGSVFTLKYVADFINGLGFEQVEIIEPHSDVTCALVNNSVARYINFELLPKVMEEVGFDKANDYVVFPDAGAQKRYASLKGIKQLVGHKHRDFATGEIKSLEIVGELTGDYHTAIIVDDLSSFGGTFVHSTKKLWEMGFQEVYLLVAHAENSIFKGELFDHVDAVFTTDSILTEHHNWENQKFKDSLKVYDIYRNFYLLEEEN